MSDPAGQDDLLTAPTPRCPYCWRPVFRDQSLCPFCSCTIKLTPPYRRPAETRDYVSTGVAAVVTLAVTIPMMVVATQSILTRPSDPTVLILMMTGWNAWFLGLPAACIAWEWIQSVRRGDEDRSYLWREYGTLQWGVLYPLLMPLIPSLMALALLGLYYRLTF